MTLFHKALISSTSIKIHLLKIPPISVRKEKHRGYSMEITEQVISMLKSLARFDVCPVLEIKHLYMNNMKQVIIPRLLYCAHLDVSQPL